MNIDILDDEYQTEFTPTDRQISFKLKLHKVVAPSVLNKLNKDTLCLLKNAVSPFDLPEIQGWVETIPFFLDWLLAPDDSDIMLHKAKKRAASTLIDILSHPGDDSKTLAIKIKAAELVLKISQPPPQKVTNKLSLPGGIPRDLMNKPISDLQGELKKLQEA